MEKIKEKIVVTICVTETLRQDQNNRDHVLHSLISRDVLGDARNLA